MSKTEFKYYNTNFIVVDKEQCALNAKNKCTKVHTLHIFRNIHNTQVDEITRERQFVFNNNNNIITNTLRCSELSTTFKISVHAVVQYNYFWKCILYNSMDNFCLATFFPG